jgi:hypothetical protein
MFIYTNYFNTKNYKMVTLQILMTNNWNWYVGGFFGMLHMVIYGPFQRRF